MISRRNAGSHSVLNRLLPSGSLRSARVLLLQLLQLHQVGLQPGTNGIFGFGGDRSLQVRDGGNTSQFA
jgi:hypothetical protein